jgi:hypothetical protein
LETASLATLRLANWGKASICNAKKERVREKIGGRIIHCVRCRREGEASPKKANKRGRLVPHISIIIIDVK